MALETRGNGPSTTYLSVDYGKKSMYIHSAEPKEGFDKHESSTGKVSYRQMVSSLTGYLTRMFFRDGNFGRELVLSFQDGDERYNVSFGIDSSIFNSVARLVENLDISKKLKFGIFENKADNGKSYFAVYMNYPEQLGADGKALKVEKGSELPAGKQLRTGKWDFSEAQDEAYGRIEKFIESNGLDSNNSSAPTASEPAKEPVEEYDDSDLPF